MVIGLNVSLRILSCRWLRCLAGAWGARPGTVPVRAPIIPSPSWGYRGGGAPLAWKAELVHGHPGQGNTPSTVDEPHARIPLLQQGERQ